MIDLTFTPVLWFILLAFAVFRLSWLFSREEGPFALLGRMHSKLDNNAAGKKYGGWRWTLAELANCPLCLGVWVSAILIIVVNFPAIFLKIILLWLAVAGAQTFLTLLIIKDE